MSGTAEDGAALVADRSGGPITTAVVIPALDAADTIGRQIRAVLDDRNHSVELVLVDNGSTDDTLSVMRAATAGHDRITIVRESRRGVNRARNAGIAATRAPNVLLCDADDEIEPGWIEALASALTSADLVGGAVRPVTSTGMATGEPFLPDRNSTFGWGLPVAWGSSCGFRRSVWQRVGGFDPYLSGGGDEAEFFLRAQIEGATFTWSERAVTRYAQRDDAEAHERRRGTETRRNLARCYWYGRLRGWPSDGHLTEDIVKSALLLPLAVVSAHRRSVLRWRSMRVWDRLRGVPALPSEVRRRIGDRSGPPPRFGPSLRFRRDWRLIDGMAGWLTRGEAAALHTAAARIPASQAVVEIGSGHGRSTTALALGRRRRRPVYAVDPRTGGLSTAKGDRPIDSERHLRRTIRELRLDNVVPVVERGVVAARHYSGPPVGLLFIDGWHSTEAVIEDFVSWAPHLAPGATVMFHDRTMPEVRTAILELRPRLPRRMLEFANLTIFSAG